MATPLTVGYNVVWSYSIPGGSYRIDTVSSNTVIQATASVPATITPIDTQADAVPATTSTTLTVMLPATGNTINLAAATTPPESTVVVSAGSQGPTNDGITPSTPTSTSSTSSSPSPFPPLNTYPALSQGNATNITTTRTGNLPSFTSSPPHPKSTGITSAEAAGIGIGSAAAGALIAAFLVFLLLRRKQRPNNSARYDTARTHPATSPTGNSSFGSDERKAGMTVGAYVLETIDSNLPPPEEDKAIANNVSRLGTMIKNHAQSYFAQAGDYEPLHFDDLDQAQLQQLLGSDTPITTEVLVTLLRIARYRIAAVRFILARAILKNTNANASLEYALLPAEMVKCVRSMDISSETGNRQAVYAKWRYLTGVLMTPSYDHKSISTTDARHENITKIVGILNSVLSRFAQQGVQGRAQNMEEIVKLGARVGYQLFVQPTTWKLDWQDHRIRPGGELIVFPALLKVGDENGQEQTYGSSQTVNISSVLR